MQPRAMSTASQHYSTFSGEWPHHTPSSAGLPVPPPVGYHPPGHDRLTYISYVDVDENMDIDPDVDGAMATVNGTPQEWAGGRRRRSRLPSFVGGFVSGLKRLPRLVRRSRASGAQSGVTDMRNVVVPEIGVEEEPEMDYEQGQHEHDEEYGRGGEHGYGVGQDPFAAGPSRQYGQPPAQGHEYGYGHVPPPHPVPAPEIQVQYSEHGTILVSASPRVSGHRDPLAVPMEHHASRQSHASYGTQRTYSQQSHPRDGEAGNGNGNGGPVIPPRMSMISSGSRRRPLPMTPGGVSGAPNAYHGKPPIPSQHSHHSQRTQRTHSRSRSHTLHTHPESPAVASVRIPRSPRGASSPRSPRSPRYPPPLGPPPRRRPLSTFTTFTMGDIPSIWELLKRMWRITCEFYNLPWVAGRVAADFNPATSSARSRSRASVQRRVTPTDLSDPSWYFPPGTAAQREAHGSPRSRDPHPRSHHRRREHTHGNGHARGGPRSSDGSYGYAPVPAGYYPYPYAFPQPPVPMYPAPRGGHHHAHSPGSPRSPGQRRRARDGSASSAGTDTAAGAYGVYGAQPMYMYAQPASPRAEERQSHSSGGSVSVPSVRRMQPMYMVPALVPAPPVRHGHGHGQGGVHSPRAPMSPGGYGLGRSRKHEQPTSQPRVIPPQDDGFQYQ